MLFIGLVWPEPKSSAAGWRIIQLIELLKKNYEIHFASAATKSVFSHDLKADGVFEHAILLNDSSFDVFIKDLDPTIVIFDRFMIEEQYGWRVSRHCPNAIRVLDTEDLHFLRSARQVSLKNSTKIDLQSDICFREIASIYRSDISLIISDIEMNILTDEFGIPSSILCFLPFIENKLSDGYVTNLPAFEQRRDLVFIGNFIHEPNWRTVEILKKDIWPLLRKKLPDAQLHIYGAYVPEKALQLNKSKDNFFIKGRAEDARLMLMKYRVLVAPIPVGAGLKGKFVDAMYSGTPSVTTAIGAEGIQVNSVWNGFITDDYADFITKTILLYTDKNIWEEAHLNGFKLFNDRFAVTRYRDDFIDTCANLIGDLSTHRKGNFIGQLLQHDSFGATKYMSLWIEAKNKTSI